MPRGPVQTIQDSVHGLMEFKDMETVVVDVLRTPEIQRLRRIHQTGLAYFVFPGAEHTRFVHSLGSAYLGIRFGQKIKESCHNYLIKSLSVDEVSIRDTAVAALCHDLGHGPLSHTWEREIIGEKYSKEKWIKSFGLEDELIFMEHLKWHEIITQAMLSDENGRLYQLLENHEEGFSKRLRHMLLGRYYLPYLPKLLSSDIDVDRADYLLRDAHQTGVKYGKYDLEWLMSTCSVGENDNGQLVIGFDYKKSNFAIEQFLFARRFLYNTIYHHKAVRCAEGMIGLFLKRIRDVVEKKEISGNDIRILKPLLKIISGEVISVKDILSIDDYSLWGFVEWVVSKKDIDATCVDLGRRILSRDLFKIVPCEKNKVKDFLLQEGGREKIYNAIKPFCSGESQYYLIEDRLSLSLLSSASDKNPYFINSNRTAFPIVDNQEYVYMKSVKEDDFRLYTITEAVKSVKDTIDEG